MNGGCCCCCCCGGCCCGGCCCCCWSLIAVLGPWLAGKNCSPTVSPTTIKMKLALYSQKMQQMLMRIIFRFEEVLLHSSLGTWCTFPHTTERVLVGLVGANASLHVWCVHSRLIRRVRGHVLPGERRWIISFREGVLQVNAASTEKQRWRVEWGAQR